MMMFSNLWYSGRTTQLFSEFLSVHLLAIPRDCSDHVHLG